MLALKSSLKVLINSQNQPKKPQSSLHTGLSPLSQSNKQETWLPGSCIINLLYSLHIPITTEVS